MRGVAAALAVALLALTLTGCEREKSNFEKCIDAGGSFEGTAWGDNCIMPDGGDR